MDGFRTWPCVSGVWELTVVPENELTSFCCTLSYELGYMSTPQSHTGIPNPLHINAAPTAQHLAAPKVKLATLPCIPYPQTPPPYKAPPAVSHLLFGPCPITFSISSTATSLRLIGSWKTPQGVGRPIGLYVLRILTVPYQIVKSVIQKV